MMSGDTAIPAAPRLPAFGWTQKLATAVARFIARRLCALEVRGLHHLPENEPCLLCANHASHADTFALATSAGVSSRRLVFLGARDYFWNVRWRRLLVQRLICLVEFERGSSAAATKANLRTLEACRNDNRIIVLFPEGTRSPDGGVRPFKPGAAMFADKLGLRVIPCHIDGAYEMLPKGRSWPRAARLTVTFGAPLSIPPARPGESGNERSDRYEAFMNEVREHVVRLGTPADAEAPLLAS